MTKEATIPNPGSEEAQEQGCLCAVFDNSRGYGYLGREGVFVVTESCPLHGKDSEWQKKKNKS